MNIPTEEPRTTTTSQPPIRGRTHISLTQPQSPYTPLAPTPAHPTVHTRSPHGPYLHPPSPSLGPPAAPHLP